MSVPAFKTSTASDSSEVTTNTLEAHSGCVDPSETDGKRLALLARYLIKSRETRTRELPGLIFGEPDWDIILDVFASEREGKRVSVKALCSTAGVPESTALRRIKLLVASGRLSRFQDESDMRRSFIELSPETSRELEAILHRMANGLCSILMRDPSIRVHASERSV